MDDTDFGLDAELEPSSALRPGVPVEPRRLLRVLHRGWRTVAACAAIGLLLGVALFFALPQTYVSRARLLYEGIEALQKKNTPDKPFALIESAMVPDNLRAVRERSQVFVSMKELEERLSVTVDTGGRDDGNQRDDR